MKVQIQTVENFGDVMKLTYNEKSKRVEAVGRISPTDTTRLLDSIASYYATRRGAKCKRISELAAELSKLVMADCSYYADTYALAVVGKTIVLEADHRKSICK